MAVNVGTVTAKFDLQDKMSRKIDAAKTKFQQFAKSAEKSGEKLKKAGERIQSAGNAMRSAGMNMTATMTAPIVAFGAASAVAFGNFEQSMNRVKAVTGSAGGDMMALQKTAEELGRTTRFSAKEAADAMASFGLAGFTANEIISVMPGTLDLAAAGMMDVQAAADIVAKTLRGYGMSASETGRVSDVMAKAFSSANTDLTMLGHAMKFAGPIAKAAGLEFEETTAVLALMADAGFQATLGGTAMRGAIMRLLSPTKKNAEIMKEFGLQVTDASGRMIPFTEIVAQLEPHADKTGKMMELFGARAGGAILAVVERGSPAITEMTQLLREAGGTTETIAKIQMEGLFGAMIKLRSATEGMFIAVGRQLSPALISLMTALKEVVMFIQTKALPAFTDLPVGVQALSIASVGAAAAMGPLLLVVGQFASIVGGVVMTVAAVKMSFIGWGTVMAGVVITAKALAVAAAAVSVAMGAWKFGKWIAESSNLGENLFRLKMRMQGWTKAQVEQMVANKAYVKAANEAGTATDRLRAQLATIGQQTMRQLEDSFYKLADANKIGRKEMDMFVARIEELAAEGKKVPQVFKDLVEQTYAYNDALAEAAAAERKASEELEAFTEEVQAAIRAMGKQGAEHQLRVLETVWANLSEEEKKNKAVLEDVASAYAVLIPKLGRDVNREFSLLQQFFQPLDLDPRQIIGAVPRPKDFSEAFPWVKIAQTMEKASTKALKSVELFGLPKIVGALSTGPIEPIVSFGKTLGESLKEGLEETVKDIPQKIIDAFTGGGSFLGAIKAIGADIGSKLGGALMGSWAKSKTQGGGSGGDSGGDSAEAIGGMVGSIASMAGPIGMAIGALAGPLIGALHKLFAGPTTQERVTKSAKQMFGVALSEGLANAIAETKEKLDLSDIGAMMMHTAEMFEEAGGVMALGMEKSIKMARDLFVMVETFELTAQQASGAFGEAFTAIAEASVNARDIAGPAFVELIELAEKFGMSAEVIKFVGEQTGKAAEGIAAMMQDTADRAQGLADKIEKAKDALAKAKKGTAEYARANKRLNQLQTQQGKLAGATARELKDMGNIAVAAFAGALKSGMSYSQAVKHIGPALDALIKTQKNLGIETDNLALKELQQFQKRVQQNQGLVAGVEALDDTMVALSHTGSLNADTLGAMERQGTAMYKKLRKAGFTEKQSMLMMKDAIIKMRDAHIKLGIPMDENTQKLVDQMTEAGVSEEKQKKGWEAVEDAVRDLTDVLAGMIEQIKGVDGAVRDIPTEVNVDVNVNYRENNRPDPIQTSVNVNTGSPNVPGGPGSPGGGHRQPGNAPGHGFHEGGIVTGPTLGMVGEAGPEAIIPLDRLEARDRDLIAEVRSLKSLLKLLPLHIRDAILMS
jgi:TP901 family phage tail tape measure protein